MVSNCKYFNVDRHHFNVNIKCVKFNIFSKKLMNNICFAHKSILVWSKGLF